MSGRDAEIIAIEGEIESAKAARRPHAEIRSLRMKAARLRGRHTKDEWAALKAEFDHRCVRCGEDGWNLERDHIRPVYQGGSDGIDNIQPLCARCNASKGPDDFDWKAHRRAHGFEGPV